MAKPMIGQGDTAVITGGGGAIGGAVAADLAASGVKVALWDRRLEDATRVAEQITSNGGTAAPFAVDVADPESVRNAAAMSAATLGPAEIVVTCAGISHFQTIDEITVADWHQMIDTHLTATFVVTQALVPAMRERQYGRIIFISSMAGQSGSGGHVHYAAAKAGIIGLGKALAKELGPSGITVNSVAPGSIETPMLEGIPEEMLKRYTDNPVGRIGTCDDVVHVVRFLADRGAGFVTGSVVNVNGGAYV